jgi:hypothetical protein
MTNASFIMPQTSFKFWKGDFSFEAKLSGRTEKSRMYEDLFNIKMKLKMFI